LKDILFCAIHLFLNANFVILHTQFVLIIISLLLIKNC